MGTSPRHARPGWWPRSPVAEVDGLPSAARRGVRALVARPTGRPDAMLGVLVGLSLAGPLVFGQATDDLAAGSVAALGALNTALADISGTAVRRIGALALAALVNAAALGLGALVAEPAWLTVVVTLVVVPVLVLSGLRSAAGRAIGIPATLTFIAGAGLPAAPAGERFVEGLAGGAWALALFAIVIVLGLRPSPPPVPATPSGVLANHAIRLGVAAAVAVALAAALSLAHGYWLAISVAIVLRPGLEPTAERITQRLAGSLLGGVAGAVIIVQVGGSWTLIVLATLLVGGATALLLADYRIASALLTAGVLTMLDVGHGISVDAVNDRLLATVVGAGLALVALLLWPEPPDPQAAGG